MNRLYDADTLALIHSWGDDSEIYYEAWGFSGTWTSEANMNNKNIYVSAAVPLILEKRSPSTRNWFVYYGDVITYKSNQP